jgi:hypothetical protein
MKRRYPQEYFRHLLEKNINGAAASETGANRKLVNMTQVKLNHKGLNSEDKNEMAYNELMLNQLK